MSQNQVFNPVNQFSCFRGIFIYRSLSHKIHGYSSLVRLMRISGTCPCDSPPLAGPMRSRSLSSLSSSIRFLMALTDMPHSFAIDETFICGFALIRANSFSCPFLALFLPHRLVFLPCRGRYLRGLLPLFQYISP